MENTTTANSADEPALQGSPQSGLKLDPATWAIAGALGKWVGEKVAGGIVGAAAGKLFSEVMDAIGLGGPDLVARLDQISNQLVEVQRSLDRLTEMTAEILKQLAALKEFFEKSLKIETLLAAMTRIDVAYNGSPTLLGEGATTSPVYLRELVEKMPHYDKMTPEKLKQAALDFAAYVSDMPDRIATIQSVLAKAAFGQDSLPMYWARELAQYVNGKKMTREAAYLVLEGYFLQAISSQLKGVSVHCVALGTDQTVGPQRIRTYLEDNFAKMMLSETAAFVEAVEVLMVSTLKPSMPTGLQDGMGEREFPKEVDELLLRADLISAALNLVAHKPDQAGKPSPSIQAAIQGIYGRTLLRPSDLNNGAAPSIAPAGYPAAAGTAVHQLPFPCLDLTFKDGRSILKDVSASPVSVAHYFWPFPSTTPAEGTPIDPSQRGGVKPARYPVFGPDQPGVLAASLFDVSRLYRGLPSGTPHSYKFDKFQGGSPDLGYYNERCTPYHHPLTNDKGDAFETFFTMVHIYRLDIRQHSFVWHPLFTYSGAPIKVRLTAHVASIIHRDPRKDGQGGTAFGQDWEVFNRLRLKHPNGSENQFYNSVDAFGVDRPISVQGSDAYSHWNDNYDARRDGVFSIDFDLVPGDYQLMLDSEIAVFVCEHRYEGWQSTSLAFFLHGLSIERL